MSLNILIVDDSPVMRSLLRQQPALDHMPVIVISTDATANRIENMIALGASGYIQKPFGPEQLRSETERVLNLIDGGAHV